MNRPYSFSIINFRSVAGLAISGVLLWLTIDRSGLMWSQIGPDKTAICYLGAAILVFIVTITIHAARTRLLWVKDGIPYGKIKAYVSLIIGNFYNCVLPGNLGEGVRAWHFHRKNNVLFSRSLAAIITEKWVDAQLFLPATLFLFYLKPPGQWHYVLSIFIITCSGILISDLLLLLMVYQKKRSRFLWRFVPFKKMRHGFYKIFYHLLNHISGLYKSGYLWGYGLTGYFILGLNLLQYFLILKAAGISGAETNFFSLYMISLAMIIINIIPSAPSNLGVVHYGIYSSLCLIATLHHTDLSPPLLQQFALASVYLHLSYFLPEIILGLVFIWRERHLLFGRNTT